MTSASVGSLVQISYLLGSALWLLAIVVGIVLCIAFWRRCPLACGLALTSLIVKLLTTVTTPLTQWLVARTYSPGSMPRFFAIVNIAGSAVGITTLGLLLAAVFVGRPRPGPCLRT